MSEMHSERNKGRAPDIIIPRGVQLTTPKRVIRCAAGNSRMRCKCGHYEFGVHVRPSIGAYAGTANVKELICLECSTSYKTDTRGNLGGGDFIDRD